MISVWNQPHYVADTVCAAIERAMPGAGDSLQTVQPVWVRGRPLFDLNSHMRELIEIVETKETKTPVETFVDEYIAATSEHPFDSNSRLYGDASLTISPSLDDPETTIDLKDIMSFTTGRNNGSIALLRVCEFADRAGVMIKLTAKAYGRMKEFMPTRALVEWFERYGFNAIQYYGDAGVDMIRYPR